MSDSAEMLVCRSDDGYEAAAAVIAGLVARRIIEPMPSNCAVGALGHRPGPEARASIAIEANPRFFEIRTNGMEVRLRNAVELFSPAVAGMPSVSCSSCENVLEEASLIEHLKPANPFLEPGPPPACKGCGSARPIHEWTVRDGAFGNLVFYFWNWPPLKPELIAEIETWCGSPVTRIQEVM